MKEIRIRYHMETGIIKPERLTYLIEEPEFGVEGNEKDGYVIELNEVKAYIEWLEDQIKTTLV